MKPIPGHCLYLDLELTTFIQLPSDFLPPLSIYYHQVASSYVALQAFTPAFYVWLRAAVAQLRLTDPAQVARNHSTLMALKSYANLRWTPAELDVPPHIITDFDHPALLTLDPPEDGSAASLYSIHCPSCRADTTYPLIRPSTCPCGKRYPRIDPDGCQYPTTRLAFVKSICVELHNVLH